MVECPRIAPKRAKNSVAIEVIAVILLKPGDQNGNPGFETKERATHATCLRRIVLMSWLLFSITLPIYSADFAFTANAGDGNISVYAINSATGALSLISGSPFADPVCGPPNSPGPCPVWVAPDSAGRFLYVTEPRSCLSSVSVFSIDSSTGGLTFVPGSTLVVGGVPQSISIHPSGKFAYVTDIVSGSISAFSVDAITGKLNAISGSPFSTSLGAVVASFHPTGRFLYVGTWTGLLYTFSIDALTGVLTAVPGSPYVGGNRAVVHPSGTFVYAGGPTPGIGYQIDAVTGTLTPLSGASDFSFRGVGAEIDPTGRFLHTTGDVENTVHGFLIDTSLGSLSEMPGSPFAAGGDAAWTALDPTGTRLYVVNGYDFNVSSYAIDAVSGSLTQIPGSPFASGYGTQAIATVRLTLTPSQAVSSLIADVAQLSSLNGGELNSLTKSLQNVLVS